jgi:hypothetical protein
MQRFPGQARTDRQFQNQLGKLHRHTVEQFFLPFTSGLAQSSQEVIKIKRIIEVKKSIFAQAFLEAVIAQPLMGWSASSSCLIMW